MPHEDADRCSLTDLPKDGCAHCRGGQSPVIDRLTGDDIGPRFPARFPGRCGNCDGSIGFGDIIAALTDGSGYACTRCLP